MLHGFTDRYAISKVLGYGKYANVYLAEHRYEDRTVAVKVFLKDNLYL